MDIYSINLCDVTEEELSYLETAVQAQIQKRQRAKEEKAINNFRKAFEELLQFVDIFYEDDGEFADLRYFDKFKFE